jgi:predicted ATPase
MGEIAMPHFIAMLAEVLIRRNDHERALGEVQRILKRNETSRDKYFNAELHRLAAECQLALGDASAAGASLRLAIDTARAQGATRFEQRAVAAMAVVDGGSSGR